MLKTSKERKKNLRLNNTGIGGNERDGGNIELFRNICEIYCCQVDWLIFASESFVSSMHMLNHFDDDGLRNYEYIIMNI